MGVKNGACPQGISSATVFAVRIDRMLISTMACPRGLLAATLRLMTLGPGSEGGLYLLWAINMLAAAFGTVFLLRRLLGGAPKDLEDAARIDGCGIWQMYWHVRLPLARRALGLAGAFILLAALDDALAPVVEMGGGLAPALYAVRVSAHGIVVGAGAMGLVMAGFLLLIPLVTVIFCAGSRRSSH